MLRACVLFTAQDAFLRDLHVVVPSDGIASNDARTNRIALDHMKKVLHADTTPSTRLDLRKLKRL